MQTIAFSSSRSSNLLLQRRPLKLIAIGDSIVYGLGDAEGGGWVERLRRRWMAVDSPSHIIYNLGVRGDRVQQVAHRLEHEFRHRGEMGNRLPDVIILSVGGNDSAHLRRPNGSYCTEFEVFKTELANLLDRAQLLCPIFFVGMVPVDEARMPFMKCFYYSQVDQYRYKEAIRLACQAHQIPYLDIFDLWLRRGNHWWRSRLQDGLHPNAIGYQSLLEDILTWEPIARLNSR